MSAQNLSETLVSPAVSMISGSGAAVFSPTLLLAIGYLIGWPESYNLGVFLAIFCTFTLVVSIAIFRAKRREQDGFK